MKSIHIFYVYLFILLLSACSKDQGNYDYSEVNKVTILDTAQDTLSGQEFDLAGDETMIVEAVAKGTMPDFKPAEVKYAWVLGKDTLAKGAKFSMTANLFQSGKNSVYLYATDPLTNLVYLSIITVSVNKTISKGALVLTKDEQNNSILYLKSSKNQLNKWFRVTALGKDNQYPLGKNPVAVDLEVRNRAYPSFSLVTKDGPNQIMLVDLASMEPYYLFKGQGAALNGGTLQPTFFKMGFTASNGDSYIMDNGRVRYLNKGFLGADVLEQKIDYDFGEKAISYDNLYNLARAGKFLMGYDKISKRILFMESNGKKNFSFPAISETKSTGVLGDMEFVGAGGDMFTTTGGVQYGMILRKGTQAYNFSTATEYNKDTRAYEFTKIQQNATATIPNIDKAINLRLNSWSGFYFYAVGRTIYRFPFFSLAAQPYFTLPDDGSGDIVFWNFDRDESSASHKNIGIATYNPSSAEAKKGSFYHYEIKTDGEGKPFTLVSKSLYQIDKAVSISMGIL